MSPYWTAWAQYPQQLFIAADQLLNALIPPLDGTLSYADETLSARSYRAHRDSRWSACGKTPPASGGTSFKGLQ